MHCIRLRITTATAAAALVLLSSAHGSAQQPPAEPPVAEEPAAAEPGAVEAAPEAAAGAEVGAVGEVTAEDAPAVEAEAEAVAEAPSAAADPEIVVTGTRIKRTQSFALPAAVAVANRKELAQTGANNMSDVVKNMTINYGSDFNLGLGTNAGGTAQFNLRGLGLNSTLVLLNGRRPVESGALSVEGASFVDINTMPLQAVERIEVLKGGASAIYGSDAVAGVVNVITRKRMNGFEAQAGYQATDDFDQSEFDVSLVGGAQGETTRLMGMVSYFKRQPLDAEDRSDLTDNGINVSTQSYPGRFFGVNAMNAPIDAQGMPRGAMGPAFQVDPGCGNPAHAPLTFVDQANPTLCRFNFNNYFMLVPDEQRLNLYGTLEQDIGDHTMAFFEAGYARTRAWRSLSPSLQFNSAVFNLPAEHVWNPTGQRLAWVGRVRGGAYPDTKQYFDSDTFHTVLGIKGDFGGLAPDSKFGEWGWELAGTWSGTRFLGKATDTFITRLQRSLNSCDPAAANYDPANCWNPFSFGPPNSEALSDQVMSHSRTVTDRELTTLTLDFNGPLFALPGGDLSLAFGAQVRRQVVAFDPDHLSRVGEHPFNGMAVPYSASRRIVAGYGEISAPVVEGLEIQAAGRLEHYQDAGSSGFNPMLGLTWTPAITFLGQQAPQASRLRVRGTYATSFVAPSQLQTSGVLNAPTALANAVPDPMNPTSFVNTPPNFINVRTESNPNLDPQKSTAFTGGLEWTPAAGMLMALDYWNYTFKDIIAPASAQQLINADFNDMNDPRISRQGSVINQVTLTFENRRKVTTHGIDFDFNYRSDFGAEAGMFSLGANLSYVLSYDIPREDFGARAASPDANCGSDTCDVAGLRNGANFARSIPRARVTVPLAWNLGANAVSVIGHFISAYKDDAVLPGMMQNSPFADIGSYLSIDLQYALTITESDRASTTLKIGVNNLLGKEPPRVATANLGYDTETHDPRGRLLYARLIQEL